MVIEFSSRRTCVMARRGMVATSNPLAAQAGLHILQHGGNAADAAVATAAVLAVVEAAATGIGGDAFALFWDGQGPTPTGLNGSGRAGQAASLENFRKRGFNEIPDRHPGAVTVPGAVRAWEDLLARHGRLSLRQVLEPAIYYAREGFPVSPTYAAAWARMLPLLRIAAQNDPSAAEYLPDGQAPVAGQVVKLPSLGRSLAEIAEAGAAVFYEGPIAEAIHQTVLRAGGDIRLGDLQAHRSEWVTPISTAYRGYDIWEIPPNGQGLAALQALNILEGYPLGDWAWDDPARLHTMIEAMRLAFADAHQYIADPQQSPVPTAALLNKAYAAERRALIREGAAMAPPRFGRPPASSDTVYLCVVDGEGQACSFINSLYMGFGSGIVAEGTGIFLQNRGANFSLHPDHPNALAPGKRPYHTIIPGMATQAGQLWAAFGVMGGFMQPQGHLQVLSAMLDDGLDPQAALDRPRWMVTHPEGQIALEEGIPFKTAARLADFGHAVRPVSGGERALFGSGQIIHRRADSGVLSGGTDPRKDGQVAAY